MVKPVKTRWNSYHDTFLRAVVLRGPIDSIAQYMIDKYEKEAAPLRARRKKVPLPPPVVAAGALNDYDWGVINNYIEILSPIRDATKMLEARGRSGLHGAIWEVIPTLDWLLKLFEEKKDRVVNATLDDYPDQDAIEDHYAINLNRGWLKLQKYFEKLDDTPVYYAAVLLHPRYKLFCQNAWADHPEWLIKGDASFKKLWLQYIERPSPSSNTPSAHLPSRRAHASSARDDYIRANTSRVAQSSINASDEYEAWKTLPPLPDDHPLANDPILYWWQERTTRPKLAQMALDILTIPATSDDCERAFSEAGDLLEPRRSKLRPDIIAALQCNRSYSRMGFKKSSR